MPAPSLLTPPAAPPEMPWAARVMLTVRSAPRLPVVSATSKFCTPWRWMPPEPFITEGPLPETVTVAAPVETFARRTS